MRDWFDGYWQQHHMERRLAGLSRWHRAAFAAATAEHALAEYRPGLCSEAQADELRRHLNELWEAIDRHSREPDNLDRAITALESAEYSDGASLVVNAHKTVYYHMPEFAIDVANDAYHAAQRIAFGRLGAMDEHEALLREMNTNIVNECLAFQDGLLVALETLPSSLVARQYVNEALNERA